MAGSPLKFRCFQCNQLLGVSRSKVGTRVACPRCSTELLVPDPEDEPVQPASDAAETTPSFLANLAGDLPIELADIRPEDIRVETHEDGPRRARPGSGPAPAPAGPPETLLTTETVPDPEPIPFLVTTDPAPQPGRASPLDITVGPALGANPAPPLVAPVESILPGLQVAGPSLAGERPLVRGRDLVLPRSVVASWSLFVLLAQLLAFVAGLLAGHYLWRVH